MAIPAIPNRFEGPFKIVFSREGVTDIYSGLITALKGLIELRWIILLPL